MVNYSRCMRNGIIKKAPVEGRFSPDGSTIVPYVALELYSEFEIGFREIRKETTRVMLINAAANWWKKLDFKPSIGDEVDIRYGILYCDSEGICIRVDSPESFSVISQKLTSTSKQDVTEYVDAVKWFTKNALNKTKND